MLEFACSSHKCALANTMPVFKKKKGDDGYDTDEVAGLAVGWATWLAFGHHGGGGLVLRWWVPANEEMLAVQWQPAWWGNSSAPQGLEVSGTCCSLSSRASGQRWRLHCRCKPLHPFANYNCEVPPFFVTYNFKHCPARYTTVHNDGAERGALECTFKTCVRRQVQAAARAPA